MDENGQPKYIICVSGTAETAFLDEKAMHIAEELGAEIVRQGAALVVGATTGFPYWAAKGAKKAGGIVVGVSPAGTKKEHVETYKLPVDYHDLIFYTGYGYNGRDLFLIKLADAVVFGPGRIGTINEFTITFEDKKPIGIFQSDLWETDELIKEIINKSHRGEEIKDLITYSSNPKELIGKMMDMVKREDPARRD